MKVKIWGARGSIPAPLTSQAIRAKIITALQGAKGLDLDDPSAIHAYVDNLPWLVRDTIGGNTPCVEIKAGDETIIVDAGTGSRALGLELMNGPCGRGEGVVHLFLSHTHWDHIQGFPFFRPAYIRGNRINIYSLHDVQTVLSDQMKAATFPVRLEQLGATISFIRLPEGQRFRLNEIELTTLELPHPGRAYAFRFEYQGSVFVYASDGEYKLLDEASLEPYIRFYSGADALIFDAQFTLRETFLKEDWGHSSALIGVDLARQAGVKRLILFHHDPTSSDSDLALMLEQTLAYASEQATSEKLEIILGQDGLELDLSPNLPYILRHRPEEKVAILQLMGDLDERIAADLQGQLTNLVNKIAAERPSLIVNLESTNRLSIAGLRILLELRHQWGTDTLVLAGPSVHIQRVIALADYLDFFAIYPTVQAAIAALALRHSLHEPGQMLKNRYRVEQRLAENETGFVIRATDTRLDRPVAIKILSASFSPATVQRFLSETRRMARLNSPNIVTVFDCDEEQGLIYLVMEYVPGKTLRQTLNAQQEISPMDIAIDILHGLEYANSKGLVHGNLKPENVMLADQVKLSDFGLRWVEHGRNLTELPMLMGGPEYLAPEQICGNPIEPRTDLYAFGVILYEMFTGHLPFYGDTADIIDQHLNAAPIPPRQLNPNLSRPLEHIILKLLAKEPGQRYHSASQLKRILLSLQRTLATPAGSKKVVLDNVPTYRRSKVIGRDIQVQKLLNLWNQAQQNQGYLAFITGEVGIGKTRLAEEVAAMLPNALILRGRCSEYENATPYFPFIEALRTYITYTSPAELERQLGDSGVILASLVPELYEIVSNLTPPAPLSDEHERLRLLHNLTQVIGRATASQPWVLLLDDLHWADALSLHAIHYLSRQLPAGLMLLGTYRYGELKADHPLRKISQDITRYPNCHTFTLGRLNKADVHQMLAEIWNPEVPEECANAIYQHTGGNPFYVEEVAKDLMDEGHVWLQDGLWHFISPFQVKLPRRIRDIILRRFNRLGPNAQEILRLAAVLGKSFTFNELLAITNSREHFLLEGLDELLERNLLSQNDDTSLAFNHEEIQDVIYNELPPLHRQLLHRQVGLALERLYEQNLPAEAGQLAQHFIKSGDPHKGFTYAMQAARYAQSIYALQLTIEWYQEAEKLAMLATIPAGQMLELYEGLGKALQTRSKGEEALNALRKMQQTANQLGDLIAEIRAWSEMATVYNRHGDYRAGLESGKRAEQLAVAAGDQAKPELARSLIGQGWANLRLGKPQQALALGQQARQICEIATNAPQKELAASLTLLGSVHAFLGNFEETTHYLEQALAVHRALNNRTAIGVTLTNLGVSAYEQGKHQTAIEFLEQSLLIHRETGNRFSEALTLSNIGGAKVELGRYAEAFDDLQRVIQIVEEIGRAMFLPETYTYLAAANLGQGKIAEALVSVLYALRLGHEMERQSHIAKAWRMLGQVIAHPNFQFVVNPLQMDEELEIPNLANFIQNPASCFAESLRIFSELGAKSDRLMTLRVWMGYEREQGHLEIVENLQEQMVL